MQEKKEVILRRLQIGGIVLVTVITVVSVAPAILDGSVSALLVAALAVLVPLVGWHEVASLRRAGVGVGGDALVRWILEAVLAIWWVTAIYEYRLGQVETECSETSDGS